MKTVIRIQDDTAIGPLATWTQQVNTPNARIVQVVQIIDGFQTEPRCFRAPWDSQSAIYSESTSQSLVGMPGKGK